MKKLFISPQTLLSRFFYYATLFWLMINYVVSCAG